jgi:beta-glucosidase/6-phospho-beta-glucosidase/beta-galactosidase
MEPHLPEGWQDDFGLIRAPLDWIGVNYYTRKRLRAVDGAWPAYGDAETVLPTTQMGWEIYPDGLRDFLLRVAREYSGDLPIHVTENGMANPDTHNRPDAERIAYLDSHLAAVQEAIAGGAPVAGLLRLVAPGQLRMVARLRKTLRHRACRFRNLGKDPESVLSGTRPMVARRRQRDPPDTKARP